MAITAEMAKQIQERMDNVHEVTRANPDWSQHQIAAHLGMTQTTVSQYQRKLRAAGKLPPPRSGPGAQSAKKPRNALVKLPPSHVAGSGVRPKPLRAYKPRPKKAPKGERVVIALSRTEKYADAVSLLRLKLQQLEAQADGVRESIKLLGGS